MASYYAMLSKNMHSIIFGLFTFHNLDHSDENFRICTISRLRAFPTNQKFPNFGIIIMQEHVTVDVKIMHMRNEVYIRPYSKIWLQGHLNLLFSKVLQVCLL